MSHQNHTVIHLIILCNTITIDHYPIPTNKHTHFSQAHTIYHPKP